MASGQKNLEEAEKFSDRVTNATKRKTEARQARRNHRTEDAECDSVFDGTHAAGIREKLNDGVTHSRAPKVMARDLVTYKLREKQNRLKFEPNRPIIFTDT